MKQQAYGRDSTQSAESSQQFNKTYDDFKPLECVLAVSFKLLAILLYLLIRYLTGQHLLAFFVTVFLHSCDFWVAKKITGPRLVGLKWLSKIDPQTNEEHWYFMSKRPGRVVSIANMATFWISMLIAIALWAVSLILNLIFLSLFYVGLGLIVQALLLSNFICYLQCRGQHQKTANLVSKKIGLDMYAEEAAP